MELQYKGEENRTNLDLIVYGVLEPKESLKKDKIYEIPDGLANQFLEHSKNWSKPLTKKIKGDK